MGTATIDEDSGTPAGADAVDSGWIGRSEAVPGSVVTAGRRRFTIASVVAVALSAIPFFWILWGPWESANPIRKTAYEDNFYDLQARAMFHGHLWLFKPGIGIEAFIHDGRSYTYFNLFPSIIRMPILLVTHDLDGKLTAPFMLVAWLLTGLFAALLLWRVRLLIRGPVGMGRIEVVSYGLVMLTLMGGSVFLFLAATPYVFNEDLAWSIAATVGGLFALLGVLERPSWGRVTASFVFLLVANLGRVTTGWALVIATVLMAVWFGLGRAGREQRRWFLPVLGAGVVPLLIGCAVNYAKFGVPFGVSNFDQVFTMVNAYRRKFLAANHNSEYGPVFIPTNLLAYLRPDGIRLTSVFPFVTLPAVPPRALSGVLFDRRYRTASLPASMPLLFLLSCWGVITAFRPKAVGRAALTRILLLASAIAGAALFIWGYIAPRYLADFVPFLVLASAVAMADIWRRLEKRNRRVRIGAVAVIAVIAVFSIVANIGMAITPNEEWNSTQLLNFVEAQKSISDVTGHPLSSMVVRASSLPPWGPANQLYVIGDCEALYISNGEYYSTVPSQQYQRITWMAVEYGHSYQHTFRITADQPHSGTASASLVSAGPNIVSVSVSPTPRHRQVRVDFGFSGVGRPRSGIPSYVTPGSTHQVVVITDPVKHLVEVTMDGVLLLSRTLVTGEPIYGPAATHQVVGVPPALTVVDLTASTPGPSLCRSLVR